jgi:hypothetical protein
MRTKGSQHLPLLGRYFDVFAHCFYLVHPVRQIVRHARV